MFGFSRKPSGPFISAIIVSAGSARRMEGIDKQQVPIDEVPVVVRSIASFEACARIREIILVCPEDAIPEYYALVQDYELDKVSTVVGGGAHRQESVFRGIESCNEEAAYYAIHDGARPLVELPVIEACIDGAFTYGAAAAGVPVKDTVKIRDANGFIASTLERQKLVAIQTPQVFEAVAYRAAMGLAKQSGNIFTDDCQLVEHAGRQVYISPGSYENIKITTPEDLALADAVLTYREEGLGAWQ